MIIKAIGSECSVGSIASMSSLALSRLGEKLLNKHRYDVDVEITPTQMLLPVYVRMLSNRIAMCRDCYGTYSLQEIESTILRIVHK